MSGYEGLDARLAELRQRAAALKFDAEVMAAQNRLAGSRLAGICVLAAALGHDLGIEPAIIESLPSSLPGDADLVAFAQIVKR